MLLRLTILAFVIAVILAEKQPEENDGAVREKKRASPLQIQDIVSQKLSQKKSNNFIPVTGTDAKEIIEGLIASGDLKRDEIKGKRIIISVGELDQVNGKAVIPERYRTKQAIKNSIIPRNRYTKVVRKERLIVKRPKQDGEPTDEVSETEASETEQTPEVAVPEQRVVTEISVVEKVAKAGKEEVASEKVEREISGNNAIFIKKSPSPAVRRPTLVGADVFTPDEADINNEVTDGINQKEGGQNNEEGVIVINENPVEASDLNQEVQKPVEQERFDLNYIKKHVPGLLDNIPGSFGAQQPRIPLKTYKKPTGLTKTKPVLLKNKNKMVKAIETDMKSFFPFGESDSSIVNPNIPIVSPIETGFAPPITNRFPQFPQSAPVIQHHQHRPRPLNTFPRHNPQQTFQQKPHFMLKPLRPPPLPFNQRAPKQFVQHPPQFRPPQFQRQHTSFARPAQQIAFAHRPVPTFQQQNLRRPQRAPVPPRFPRVQGQQEDWRPVTVSPSAKTHFQVFEGPTTHQQVRQARFAAPGPFQPVNPHQQPENPRFRPFFVQRRNPFENPTFQIRPV